MAEKNFVVKGSIVLDDRTIDLSSTQTGSSLHRIGDTVTAKRETPIGTVVMYTGLINGTKTNLPAGWLLCDGSETEVSSYPDLDAVVGTRYGARTNGSGGAGTSHFRLPNLVNRLPIGHIQTNSDAPNTISTPSSTEGLVSHTHSRGHSSSSWGDGAGEFLNHTHGINAHAHNHGNAGDAGSADTHNIGSAGSHVHSYKPGNANSQTGFRDSSHTHGVGNANANHSHNAISNTEEHGHNGNTTSLQHLHQVTIPTSDANETMNNSSHQHATGLSTVKTFFIIKALYEV